MKVTYKESIEYKILTLIKRSTKTVFLRKDFVTLGRYRQVSRALNKLIELKKLVKIGFGIYAKAYQSEYIDYPLIQEGFEVAARKALDRLGVQWELSSPEQAYNEGKTQQVPVNNMVKLKARFRRKIAYQNRALLFEGNVNAR